MTYRSIHKFALPMPVNAIYVAKGARVLCVQNQDNLPCIWFEVDPDAPDERREFITVPTGGLVDLGAEYVGTAHGVEGWLVFHIYERPAKTGSQ
jgi:hypothetical protein